MAVVTQADIEREASTIARAYWAGRGNNGNELDALTEKVARDQMLNADQIRLLGRAVNTKTFEEKFASSEGNDRRPEFTPVDPDAVVARVVQAVSDPTLKTAAALYPVLDDEFAPPATVEKVAFDAVIEAAIPKPKREVSLETWKKVAFDKKAEADGAAFEWGSIMERLYDRGRRLDWNHDTFEKNAVALFGPDALPELDAFRRHRGMATLGTNHEREPFVKKLAELQEQWVGFEDAATGLLKKAMDARARASQASREHQVAADQLSARLKGSR